MENLPFWVALLVMLIGLAGTVLPGLPGVGFIWLAALVYGFVEGFATMTPWVLVVLGVLAAIGMVADFVLTQAATKMAGASWQAIAAGSVLGIVGFLLGLFVGGIGALPAAVIGTLVGILVVEFQHRKDWADALRAGGGWLAGCIASRALQLVLGVVMIGIFVWRAGFIG